MGNPALSKLWNEWPDNMKACSAPERDFLPSMEDYFHEAIEQLDPANQVEEQYRKVNDGQWGWRALRLLAKKSPHFFTHGNNPIAKLPDYLESMLKKMPNAKDISSNAGSLNGSKDAKTPTSPPPPAQETCTSDQLSKIASKLGDKWVKLVPKLGLSDDHVKQIKEEGKDDKGTYVA